ncbi:hypothetical protein ALC60_08472 [Trachymyrmex zeteki]|uniref:Double jelly roll-like domain-containing protein n=1 Tax=Mycetomoellerius zeteki TaxID=64791 RepID=A0A151WWX5_9HYME|nr:hypothetical protein ALC60_08472 [Trachymyrmex zeteki]
MYLALCHPSDILDLSAEQLQYIPKIVLLRVYGDYIDHVWDKLPEHVKADSETHTYNPFANTTFGYRDELRIPTQQQDLYTLPCESFLYVEGRLTVKKKNDQTLTTLVNNCVAFMFDEIRYELNGVEIDRNRNVGITSTLKNYVSLTYDKSLIALNAGWNTRSNTEEGHFNFCVTNTMRCGKHVKNCALQNVFKIYNWSLQRQKELYRI